MSARPAQPIIVRDLRVAFRADPVLTGIDLTAAPGRRVALVGENGVGKSTLLRAVAGRLPPTARVTGHVERPDDLVLVAQEPPFHDTATIADVLGTALRPLREGVAELERLATRLDEPDAAERYADLLDWAAAHDAWDADRRALLAADRLGLGALDP
ncbi:MAG: ATP-binding cassette domain-containing protein, partial [Nocardioides sp.]|uniref:ATP-binding cassette domain-containing protein n=1 Tax=Nocardioides sp. TaxID=35761 RepID=UPI0039E458AC